MDDGLLPIGMFSRASLLSIKSLRAYHEAGILVPARVDPATGYRSYTVDQLADAAIVQRLRALDLPLEQVREVLHARDPSLTRAVLERHQETMQARLVETERIVAELQAGHAPSTYTPVHIRTEERRDTICVRGTVTAANFAAWLDDAYTTLYGLLDVVGVAPAGPSAALYGAEIAEDDVEPVEAFVPISEPFPLPRRERVVTLGEVPGATVAVLVHAGDYDTIADTYRTLGAWVARHADHAGERVREWYVVGSGDAEDPADYRTEISWPIRPE